MAEIYLDSLQNASFNVKNVIMKQKYTPLSLSKRWNQNISLYNSPKIVFLPSITSCHTIEKTIVI